MRQQANCDGGMSALPPKADSCGDGGIGVQLVFRREIVYPNGHVEIEGVTPKTLPASDASHALPRPTDPTDDTDEGAV